MKIYKRSVLKAWAYIIMIIIISSSSIVVIQCIYWRKIVS